MLDSLKLAYITEEGKLKKPMKLGLKIHVGFTQIGIWRANVLFLLAQVAKLGSPPQKWLLSISFLLFTI